MTDWNGAFLRKHVVGVAYSEDRPSRAGEDVEVSASGYFLVTFGGGGATDHSEGTYVYPASKRQVEEYLAGTLDVTEFYGW